MACAELTQGPVKAKGVMRVGLLAGAGAGFRDQVSLRGD